MKVETMTIAAEGKLRRRWLGCCVRWAVHMDPLLKTASGGHRANWWVAFGRRRRHRHTPNPNTRDAGPIKKNFVRRYHAKLHHGIRFGHITIPCNGDAMCMSTEPCPKTTLHVKGGKSRVVVRVRGNLHTNITVYSPVPNCPPPPPTKKK